jgi:hypothetical protein
MRDLKDGRVAQQTGIAKLKVGRRLADGKTDDGAIERQTD